MSRVIEQEDYEQIIGFLVHIIQWNGTYVYLKDLEEETWKMIAERYKPITDQWKRDKIQKYIKTGEH